MVTPNRIVVGAHYGWRDWLVQRVSAVLMVLYTVLVFGLLLWHGGLDYVAWKSIFASQTFRLATFVLIAALLWHTWIGVRNIAMDYLKPYFLRIAVDVAVIVLLIGYAGWAIQILWGGV